MKKRVLIIITVLTLLIISAIPASAASGKLSVKSSALDDYNITLDLYAQHPSAMIAATAMVEYDSSVLKLVDTTNGTVFKSIYVKSQTIETNPYTLMYVDINKAESPTNGLLASYTFEILDAAKAGDTEVKFYFGQALDRNSKELTFSGCTFKLKLTDSTPSSGSTASAVIGESTITLPKPDLGINIMVESAPNQDAPTSIQQGADNTTDNSDKTNSDSKNDDNENGEDKDSNSGLDSTVIALIAIGGVLVAGVVITLVFVFIKKPSAKDE